MAAAPVDPELPIEIITNQKGGEKLVRGDYLYTKKKSGTEFDYYICSKRVGHNCKASLKVTVDKSQSMVSFLSHVAKG